MYKPKHDGVNESLRVTDTAKRRTEMKRIILISTLVIVSISLIVITGCSSREVVTVHDDEGSGELTANNGKAGTGTPKVITAKKQPADGDLENAPANAKARAGSAESVTGSATAQQAAGALNKAEAKSMVKSTGKFTLKHDGWKVTLKVAGHFEVDLQDPASNPTIRIEANIKDSAGNVKASIDKTYDFKPKAAGTKIDMLTAGAIVITLQTNPGKDSFPELKAVQQTLNKGDYTTELKLTITTGPTGDLTKAIVDKLEMSLPEN